MKNILIAILTTFALLTSHLRADEGMWLPLFVKRLNHVDMKKMGCKLTAEEIYDINKSSLKDAIVMLSGGSCTAEVISVDGLLLTNHHCGYDAIQSHSSVENDYLTNGFWAKMRTDELPSEDLTASFLVRIEDLTARITAELNSSMSESERNAKVRQLSQIIEAEATQGTNYNASVKSMFNGNEYYLFVYQTYRDVRLVGAPPESVGKFGGDTDNWMWPRHTGDFTLLRVYAGADNQPADYSPDNVPYKPKHSLPISLDGVNENDFSMIMGYPGNTDRYLTSFGVKQALELTNPAIVKLREEKLRIMKEDMDASTDIRIKYAANYAQTANYWKYFIGQSEQLKKHNIAKEKQEIETRFKTWVGQDPQRQAKYGNALAELEAAYADMEKYALLRTYLSEAVISGSKILRMAYQLSGVKELAADSTKAEAIPEVIASLREMGVEFYKDYNESTERKLFTAMMAAYARGIAVNQQPAYLDSIAKANNNNFIAFAGNVFGNSYLANHQKFNELLDKGDLTLLGSDPAIITFEAFFSLFTTKFRPVTTEISARMEKANRAFIAGLREMMSDKKFYPNANSTMRLTYGSVKPYDPRDAVSYHYYSTLNGVMEKESKTNPEFFVPEKLKQLYEAKDYGIYGSNGNLNTCFLSNNDITGGNSGSPVIDGKGQLIGCAFDGNWEAMSGDIFFDDNVQRTISVDIRYILFIIDKYAGAGHIVDEMKLMRKGKVVKRI
jgi:hypothetical protein